MAIRDNAQDFLEKVKKNSSAIVAAAITYILVLLIVCGWVADIADKDQSLISSKSITMEQIKAMSQMSYWVSKTWFWSVLLATVLVYLLIKAADGNKKASTSKAVLLTASSVITMVFIQGWMVVSKAALLKSLLGNWTKLIPLIIVIWLARKFWPKLKKFFEPKEG